MAIYLPNNLYLSGRVQSRLSLARWSFASRFVLALIMSRSTHIMASISHRPPLGPHAPLSHFPPSCIRGGIWELTWRKVKPKRENSPSQRNMRSPGDFYPFKRFYNKTIICQMANTHSVCVCVIHIEVISNKARCRQPTPIICHIGGSRKFVLFSVFCCICCWLRMHSESQNDNLCLLAIFEYNWSWNRPATGEGAFQIFNFPFSVNNRKIHKMYECGIWIWISICNNNCIAVGEEKQKIMKTKKQQGNPWICKTFLK